jgi:acetyl esterase/lipase
MPNQQPMFNLPPEARARMAEIGPVWGSEIQKNRGHVLEAYTPLLKKAPKAGITVTPDLAYGPHARHQLNVFSQAGTKDADVVVFVHGGAFVRGNKSDNGEIYDNVLYYFAHQGCIGVNIEYRLAPEAQYPGAAADVRDALAWVRANIAEYGGNPKRIFLIGHSAGGTHVGTYAFDPVMQRAEDDGLAGVILVSARLRADVSPLNPNAQAVRAYFGDDASLYEERSPVTHAARNTTLPVMIAIAEFENPLLDAYGAEMYQALRLSRKGTPRFVQLMAHNHTSIMAHLNTEEDWLGGEILAFMRAA